MSTQESARCIVPGVHVPDREIKVQVDGSAVQVWVKALNGFNAQCYVFAMRKGVEQAEFIRQANDWNDLVNISAKINAGEL